ncbi:MAG TPA: ParB-like protein [Sphingobium sp.]
MLGTSPEPLLHPMRLDELRPTQLTVGYREVALKRQEWVMRKTPERPEYLGQHMIPAVIGPKDQRWIVDHHHLALALLKEGVEHVLVSVIADLSHLKKATFLTYMDNRNWLHPFDEEGRRQDYGALPRHLGKLVDDPYRSLAGAARRAGGYAKVETPYAEFLWADYLRSRIKAAKIEAQFDSCVVKAVALARSRDARHLPGWSGPQ